MRDILDQRTNSPEEMKQTKPNEVNSALNDLLCCPFCGGEAKWEPIETAPKDGIHILLYRPEIQYVGYYGGANSGWRINAPGLPALCPMPTHWMNLPNQPAEG